MAKTVVPIELSSTPGIVDNSNATAITIDSSEDVTLAGHIVLTDSKEVKLGASTDLRLYHDSNHSYIVNATGDLVLHNNADDKDIILKSDDGSGGATAYITVDGSATKTVFSKNTLYSDSIRAQFGDGGDMSIFHNATDTYIQNATGTLIIENTLDDSDIDFKSDDGSGGTTSYLKLDGSATTTVFSKNTRHADNVLIQVGDGNDAAFYHNSSDSDTYFTNDTGHLKFRQFADDKDIVFDCDDGSGGIARYLTLDGSTKFIQFDQHAKFTDSIKLDLGNSSDLQIYHSGSHSYIENNTGDLVLLNNADDKDIIFQSDDGSGGTQTYLTIDGSADRTVFSRSSRHSDNVVATFGTGEDLQIYHDGSNSYVADGGTGHLILKGTNMNLQAANGESYIFAAENAGVTLYYDGSSKLATNTNGVEITGSFYFGDSEEALFGAGNDMQIYHNGTDSYIKNATGTLKIATETSGIAVTIGHSTSEVTVADNLTVTGNLTVSGTTTTVNSTTLDVADLNITVGKSATTSSATDGAGLTFGAWSSGTIPTLTWDHSNTRLSVNKPFNVTGALTVDDITINGSTISDGGDLTVDVTGVLNLDATTQIILKDDGTNYGTFYQSSSDFYIQSLVQDKDIVLYGNDGGSGIAALTLDMSDAGTATFNHDVKLGDDSELVLGAGSDLKFYHSSSVNYIKTNSDLPLKIWDAGGAGILEMTPNGKVGIFHNGSEKIYTTSTGAVIAHTSDTDYSSTGEPAGILTLYNSSGSDGAGVNNYSSLEFNTGDGATSQGFINYVRTADNQGKFTFSQRTGSSSYAEAMSILNDGTLYVGNNTDTQSILGRTALGFVTGLSDYAYVGHLDVADSGGYALVQSSAGATFLNAEDGQDLSFSIHGTRKMVLDSNGKVGIGTTSPLSPVSYTHLTLPTKA